MGGAYDATIFLTHKHVGRRTSLIIDPPDGQRPAFAPEAQQRRDEMHEYNLALLQATDACKAGRPGCPPYGPPSPRRDEAPPHYLTTEVNRSYHPEDRSLSERCMGARLPDFGNITGFFLQIVQSPAAVSIFYDTGQGQGWQRVIPVTDRPHLPSAVRQWHGDSRARWEGDTLVVDVTNFTPKTDFHGARENLHLVERWTRLDAETIEYVATTEDPTTWVGPWTATFELSLQSNEANRIYKEPRCHEGNYGLPALLAGGPRRGAGVRRGPRSRPPLRCASPGRPAPAAASHLGSPSPVRVPTPCAAEDRRLATGLTAPPTGSAAPSAPRGRSRIPYGRSGASGSTATSENPHPLASSR